VKYIIHFNDGLGIATSGSTEEKLESQAFVSDQKVNYMVSGISQIEILKGGGQGVSSKSASIPNGY